MDADNLFEEIALYSEDGRQIGPIDRDSAHRFRENLHGAVHIFVFDPEGKLLLQKRSLKKILNPGKFDISAGGHIAYGENEYDAARRELEEELGIRDTKLNFLYSYLWEYSLEREYVFTYYIIYNGRIDFLKSEIDGVRFFKIYEITSDEIFTKNLLYEINLLKNSEIGKRLYELSKDQRD